MAKLTPARRVLLQAVADGLALRDSSPPYRTWLRGSKTTEFVNPRVLDGIKEYLVLDLNGDDPTWILNEAGRKILAGAGE